ncbi:LysR family transcriptional regulator [Vibrio campbellii]|uniref:LysR family transcriptional regulator n=1 Tax=Vibrio campbellii TaxID=680 RepID=UPI0005F08A08|nr:LysR family transcriptional regulator [Vibrio campbellii]
MDLNLLKTFDAVMKTQSVNEAANFLGITAPAVSHALSRLRDQYQDALFIRRGRGIEPTNFALELHAEIKDSLNILMGSAQSRQSFTPTESQRTFRISSHKDIDLMVLPSLIKHRDQHAPMVNFEMDIEHLNEEARQTDLRMKRVDLILATVPLLDKGYHNHLLFEQDLVVVCRPDHPRIHDSISEQQFFSEKHLQWNTRRMNSDIINSLSTENLRPREIAYTTGSIYTALMLTLQTDWISVSSIWHAKQLSKHQNIKILPIPFELTPLPVYMTWHQSQQFDTGHRWLKDTLINVTENLNSQ